MLYEQMIYENDSIYQKAYMVLKNAILIGTQKSGELLKERGLTECFKLSKTPVRESLRILREEGLVSSIPRAGCMVTHITPNEIQQWYQVHLILESAVVELVTTNAMENILRKLKNYANFFFTHGNTQSCRESLRQNTTFHRRVALASGNQVLANMVLQVLQKLVRAFYLKLGLRDSAFEMTVAHRQLVEALLHRGARALARFSIKRSWARNSASTKLWLVATKLLLGKRMIHERPMWLSINPSISAREEVI